MLKRPFRALAVLLLASVACPIFLPLIPLLGYAGLLAIGVLCAGRWYADQLDEPAQVAAVWAVYLGLILTLHGIIICIDSPLKGAPPTAAEKRFGAGLAYAGGAIATVSVVVAYLTDAARRASGAAPSNPVPVDEHPS